LDLIELALNGKQKGFGKVVAMIDSMVKNLQNEQTDDDAKKSYCDKSFDETDDKKKVLEGSISDSQLAIEEMTGAIETLTKEIAELEAGIAKLDKAVAEATEQRKEESAAYEELVASDTTAKEILLFAKNRLNKFYNPKLYKPPAKEELDSESRIVESFAFAQKAAPPPPPETFGPYSKKTEESGGVIAMIDLLVGDLEKELQTAKVDEDNAQEEYEKLTADAGDKRKQDSATLTEKKSTKATSEEALDAEKTKKGDTSTELMGLVKEIYALHGECDWLLKFYDARRDARTGEIDALTKAKAVLSGADYSLLQTAKRSAGFLASQ
jgi:septal ring factor EnvC (AmiA/AmiB activator)